MEQAPFHAPESQKRSLDEWILDDPEASFLMKMEGDSMNDYGIHHGDMLVIERAAEARKNDLVIIVRDGNWSVDAYNRLERFPGTFTVHAVIKALVRKYI